MERPMPATDQRIAARLLVASLVGMLCAVVAGIVMFKLDQRLAEGYPSLAYLARLLVYGHAEETVIRALILGIAGIAIVIRLIRSDWMGDRRFGAVAVVVIGVAAVGNLYWAWMLERSFAASFPKEGRDLGYGFGGAWAYWMPFNYASLCANLALGFLMASVILGMIVRSSRKGARESGSPPGPRLSGS